ncbi:MAG: hypothetical protein ABI207_03290, partial [Crocinitomicaceae bacterium]
CRSCNSKKGIIDVFEFINKFKIKPFSNLSKKLDTLSKKLNTLEEEEQEQYKDKDKKKKEEEPEFIFSLQGIYDKNWDEYSAILNGQAKYLNEKKFNDWKHFVDFINEKGFTNLYEARFVSPIEFDKIVSSGFTKNKWEKVLKAILATGVKPEHNLFFRIPQFMNYSKTESGELIQPKISI